MKTIRIQHYSSPCGELILGSLEDKLCLCDWVGRKNRAGVDRRVQHALSAGYELGSSDVTARAALGLDEYFARRRQEFDFPLLFAGTDFQKAVWRQLLSVVYGETLSYGALSCRLGRPEAVRAVAAAVGANPLSIFVPCHRIVGSNGRLTGYAGGLAAKQGLLHLEREAALLPFRG